MEQAGPDVEGELAALTAQPDAAVAASAAGPEPNRVQEWRESLARTDLGEGCFESEYPNTTWKQVPCTKVKNPLPAPAPNRFPPSRRGSFDTATVGITDDVMGQVTGPMLSAALGSFPSVSGVVSESDGVTNSFSLQLNTNTFPGGAGGTPMCSGAANPAACRGWQQFIFANDGTTAAGFIQYWLIDYNTACPPAPWITYNPPVPPGAFVPTYCWKNSTNAVSIPVQTISSLSNMQVRGNAGANDKVTFLMGTQAWAQSQASVLNLSQFWNFAEFNIFGINGGRPVATITGTTPTIDPQISFTNGRWGSPTCSRGSTTGESNNLNLTTSSCCPTGGPAGQSIRFRESSDIRVKAPFCLLTEIIPILMPIRGG